MNRRFAVVILTILMSLSVIVAPTQAAEQLDQEQLIFKDSLSANVGDAPGFSPAQTFTAGVSGALSRVRVQLGNYPNNRSHPHLGGTADVIVEIRAVDGAGAPTGMNTPGSGTVLSSATIPGFSIPEVGDYSLPGALIDVTFAVPATVEAGTTYAIVLLTSSDTSYHWNGAWDWNNSAFDAYAGGSFWACPWLGTCWNNVFVPSAADLVFQTYVDPSTTAPGNPSDALDELELSVLNLSTLTADQMQTLIDLLLTTNEYLAFGEYEDAVDKLYDFIDKIQDYVENGSLLELAGEGLIDHVEAIIAQIQALMAT